MPAETTYTVCIRGKLNSSGGNGPSSAVFSILLQCIINKFVSYDSLIKQHKDHETACYLLCFQGHQIIEDLINMQEIMIFTVITLDMNVLYRLMNKATNRTRLFTTGGMFHDPKAKRIFAILYRLMNERPTGNSTRFFSVS